MTDIELRKAAALEWFEECLDGDGENARFVRELLAPSPQSPDNEVELSDIIAWADGIQGALGTEYASRVTENEAYISDCVLRGFKAAQQPRQEWLDISTAPRDGTQILLASTMKKVGHPNTICVVANAQWNDEHEVWCDIEGLMRNEDVEYWMPLKPLPSPPKEK